MELPICGPSPNPSIGATRELKQYVEKKCGLQVLENPS